MAGDELIVRGEIRSLRLSPGEVIVVSLAHEPRQEEAERIKELLTSKLGDEIAVLVHGPNTKIGKIERMP